MELILRGVALGELQPKEALNRSPQMRGNPDRDGVQGGFRRQYLDIGKKFNAADRLSPGDRALRGTCSALPSTRRGANYGMISVGALASDQPFLHLPPRISNLILT